VLSVLGAGSSLLGKVSFFRGCCSGGGLGFLSQLSWTWGFVREGRDIFSLEFLGSLGNSLWKGWRMELLRLGAGVVFLLQLKIRGLGASHFLRFYLCSLEV